MSSTVSPPGMNPRSSRFWLSTACRPPECPDCPRGGTGFGVVDKRRSLLLSFFRTHRSGRRRLSRQWLWPLRHDRQRVGVDRDRFTSHGRETSGKSCCVPSELGG